MGSAQTRKEREPLDPLYFFTRRKGSKARNVFLALETNFIFTQRCQGQKEHSSR